MTDLATPSLARLDPCSTHANAWPDCRCQNTCSSGRHAAAAILLKVLCLQEVRSILRARKLGVPTPVLYYVEHDAASIYMEKVQGVSVKEALQGKQLDQQGRCSHKIHNRCRAC